MRHMTVMAVVILMASAASAAAQVIDVDGDVVVVDDGGRRVEGVVREATADRIRIASKGVLITLDVSRIVLIERADGVGDGAQRGFAFGVTLGLVSGALMASGGEGNVAGAMSIGALVNGWLYAGIGAGLDALVDHRKTLYERGRGASVRVSPLSGQGARGALVSFRW